MKVFTNDSKTKMSVMVDNEISNPIDIHDIKTPINFLILYREDNILEVAETHQEANEKAKKHKGSRIYWYNS